MPARRLATLLAGLGAAWSSPALAAAVALSLVELTDAVDRPTAVVHAGDGSGRVFISEKPGRIRVFADGELQEAPFLDISERVKSNLFEQGLVGIAFHPGFAANRFFYVAYTDLAGDSVISRFAADTSGGVGDPDSEVPVLVVEQPFATHNVNHLAFGPDGYLYVSSGDGGPGMDPDDRGQDLGTLLGKILRLDVDGGSPYAVPPDNPFVDLPGARAEIWSYGLRNPARLSFDRASGDLYIGDVGQNSWEEIDRQDADSAGGENYGWSLMEGTHCFDPPVDCDPGGLTPPILEYANGGQECAVTGGYVYRGPQPEIQGLYLFSDFCSGRIWGGTAGCDGAWRAELLSEPGFLISTFGETEHGELLVAEWAVREARLFRVEAEPTGELLADGFENGSLAAWDQCVLGALGGGRPAAFGGAS